MALSIVIGVLGLLAGLALAIVEEIEPGPAVALVLAGFFVVSFSLGRHGSLFARRTPRVHLEA